MALRTRSPANGDEEPGGPDGPDRMTLVEHLAELRHRIIVVVLAVAVGGAIGFSLYEPVLEALREPYTEVTGNPEFLVTDPLEQLSIRFKLATYIGLLIASPIVLWQLWRFITPGLYPKEKRYAIPFVLSSVILFLAGAALAFWTFPKTLEFFDYIGGEQLNAEYTPGKYVGLLTTMMLVFALGFEFPVVLTFLQIAGVLGWRRLGSWRRYAIIGVFVVGAVITPSGDPVTLLALAVPICLLYEVSILLGRFVIKRQ